MTDDNPSPSASTTEAASADPQAPSPQGPEALKEISNQLAEISEYLSYYLQTQMERAKLSMRETVMGLSLIPVLLLLLSGTLLLALGFMGYGIATGLTGWLGGRAWLAYLITGGSFLLGFGFLLISFITGKGKRNLKRRVREYEADQVRQKKEYGHSLADQAAVASQE